MKRVVWVLAILLLIEIGRGAIIYGTVYDFSLEPVHNVKVKIGAEQQIVALNGRYSFNVTPGNYTITAEQFEDGEIVAKAAEPVFIESEGSYVVDLILFPYIPERELGPSTFDYITLGILLAVIIVLIIVYVRVRKIMSNYMGKDHVKEEPLSNDLVEVVEFVKSQNNRATQKEIRQKFAKSEATISLMIADLERKGMVEKIKKGRGNIVIMK